jgi:hypothetical protein
VERIGFRTRSCLLCGRKLFAVREEVVCGCGWKRKAREEVEICWIDLVVRLWHTIALAV